MPFVNERPLLLKTVLCHPQWYKSSQFWLAPLGLPACFIHWTTTCCVWLWHHKACLLLHLQPTQGAVLICSTCFASGRSPRLALTYEGAALPFVSRIGRATAKDDFPYPETGMPEILRSFLTWLKETAKSYVPVFRIAVRMGSWSDHVVLHDFNIKL